MLLQTRSERRIVLLRNRFVGSRSFRPTFAYLGFSCGCRSGCTAKRGRDEAGSRPAALQHILDGHLPFPAIIVNSRGELVAANPAIHLLTEDVRPELLAPPINAYRLALHPRECAPRIRNLNEWGRHVTERLRLDPLRNPDPELDALRSEHGDLRLITTITTFATATDVTLAELKLEAFLPADDATSTVLTDLNAPNRSNTQQTLVRP